MTDYESACLIQAYFRPDPLPSIGDTAKNKNGASVAFHIPHREKGADEEGVGENSDRILDQIMGGVDETLEKIKKSCRVNEDFGSYDDCLALLGNLWTLQRVFFTAEPKSELALFAELVGDCLSQPHIRRWMVSSEVTKPEIAYAILNVCEQVYLLLTGITRKRGECQKIVSGSWDGVDASPYEEVRELGERIVAKMESASRGGETFTACRLFENSTKAAAIKRAAEEKAARKILEMKRELERKVGERDSKKPRREREPDKSGDKDKDKTRKAATDADKVGDIVFSNFLTMPAGLKGKTPCGAYYRDGVACAKMLNTGKCDKDHTPINQASADNKKVWLEHVNGTDGMEFNSKTVTCFKKQGDKYVAV